MSAYGTPSFLFSLKKTKDKDKAGIIKICCENELSKIVPLAEIKE